MVDKPAYQELEQRVAELQKELVTYKRTSEERGREKDIFLGGPVVVFKWLAVNNWPAGYVSPNITRFGYQADDFVSGRIHYMDIVHPEDRERVLSEVREHSESGEDFCEQEYRIIQADGAVKWVHDFTTVGRNGRREITHYDGYILEVTERKRAEEALKSQLDLERVIADVSTSFINMAPNEFDDRINRALETIGSFCGVDRSYVFLFYDNGTTMDNTHEWCAEGVEPQQDNLKGLSVDVFPWWMDRLHRFENIHIPCVADIVSEASAEKETLQSQDIQSIVVVPMVYGGSLLGFLGFDSVHVEKTWPKESIRLLQLVAEIFANALQHVRAEKEKKQLEAQFQQAQKMEAIGTLAGGIAHDFNNVLMGIQGHATLMLMRTDPEHPHFQRLQGIEDMVQTGANLTKQLLGFARGGKYDVKPTDLNELIENSSEMFGRTQKNVEIDRKYQRRILPVEVDRGQLEQVLLNLFVNAWHAMPSGGRVYVETSNVTLDEKDTNPFGVKPGNYVRMSVTDTGAGMDEATRRKIFDPFFTTKEMGRGTGLGLASAYGIIKNHGGIINVNSEKQAGTTFDIYLPASKKDIAVEEKKPVYEILKGTETVLLVDDEDTILDVGKDMLAETGYKVLVARSGKEAIEVYRKNWDNIALVIVDMVMPEMGGGEVYDIMKENNPKVKALLASGYSIDGQATEILERGCDGFIQKPFDVKALFGKIREILDKE
jgi:PAS domain S-box-containing protein